MPLVKSSSKTARNKNIKTRSQRASHLNKPWQLATRFSEERRRKGKQHELSKHQPRYQELRLRRELGDQWTRYKNSFSHSD